MKMLILIGQNKTNTMTLKDKLWQEFAHGRSEMINQDDRNKLSEIRDNVFHLLEDVYGINLNRK